MLLLIQQFDQTASRLWITGLCESASVFDSLGFWAAPHNAPKCHALFRFTWPGAIFMEDKLNSRLPAHRQRAGLRCLARVIADSASSTPGALTWGIFRTRWAYSGNQGRDTSDNRRCSAKRVFMAQFSSVFPVEDHYALCDNITYKMTRGKCKRQRPDLCVSCFKRQRP